MTGSPPGEPERVDGLTCLAGAVYAYLREIDAYRGVCSRCAGTAVVRERAAWLEVTRWYKPTDEALTHLGSALGRLPEHRPTQARREGYRREAGDDSPITLPRHITWEHRPAVVRSSLTGSDARTLQVTLLLHREAGDLPELPLRTLASALLCHEFLLPEVIASPLPPGRAPRSLSVRAYLLRAMPPNLYAGQCIRDAGAA
jgi:hypothetical protein